MCAEVSGASKNQLAAARPSTRCPTRRCRRIEIVFALLCLLIVCCLWPRELSASSRTALFIPPPKKPWSNRTIARQPATSSYVRHFRSIFIPEPSSPDPGSEEASSQISLSKAVSNGRVSDVQTKLIVMFNMPPWIEKKSDHELFGHCPVRTCSLSTEYQADRVKAKAVVFHDVPREGTPVPLRPSPEQVYVFYMVEPPPIAMARHHKTAWNSVFNWTWTYRQDADIWTPYLFLRRSKEIPSVSFLLEMSRKKDRPVAWFVSNCHSDNSRRTEYVERLQKVFPVDVYGKCGTLECPRMSSECDVMLSTRYYFYLSFENSFCQDYVTEKFSRAFFDDVYVVPVVRGGLNYTHHFPEGTFIDANAYSSPEELGQYLRQLMSDEEKYIDMLWRIAHFTTGGYHDSYRYSWCQFCSKLHSLQVNAKTYPDLFQWYSEGKCWLPKHF